MKKNEAGFSLIQVMIAFGLVGMLSLFIMRIVGSGFKSQKGLEVKNALNEVFGRINSYVKTNPICETAFGELKAGENLQFFHINQAGTGTKLVPGEEVGNSSALVEELKILENPTLVDASTGLYELTFEATLKKKGTSKQYYGAGNTIKKRFTFLATLCEPWVRVYSNTVEFNNAKAQCIADGNEAGIDTYSYTPEDSRTQPVGSFICNLCGADKVVAECKN